MSQRQQLTEKFVRLEETKAELKKKLSEVQAELDQTEQDLINCMQNEDLESFKDERFGTIFMRNSCHAKVEDSFNAFNWFRKNGYGDVIKETIHASTLAAIMREIPDDVPGVKRYDFISICRRKKS